MNDQLERNKQNATGFYDLMFNQCKPAEAVSKFVGDVYMQHNPHVADGKEAFIAYFERMAKEYPANACTSSASSRRVTTLSCYQEWLGGQHWAGIDIFRLDTNGKIVEHWDVLQVVPESSANRNTMF